MYQILSIRVALIKKDKSYCDHESVQIPPPFLTLLTLVNFFTIYLEKKLSLFFFSGKTGSQIRTFFVLKPFRDQDRANKKNISQISSAVPEEIGCKQAYTHTSKHRVAI